MAAWTSGHQRKEAGNASRKSIHRKGLNPKPLRSSDWRLKAHSVTADSVVNITPPQRPPNVFASDISEVPRNDGVRPGRVPVSCHPSALANVVIRYNFTPIGGKLAFGR